MLLLACLLGLGEVGMCVSSLLLSPFLCVTHRDRVWISVYGLYVCCFLLRSSVQNQIWENNSDVITCLFMFVCPCHICHVYMLSLACWNFTYQELSGGWVGSSLTFCHAVFISHPTRSMHSFPPWDLWDNETQCSEFFVCEWMQFNDVAMQQQPHHAEPEIFPLSAQDGKVCARSFISAAHSVWTCRSKICK